MRRFTSLLSITALSISACTVNINQTGGGDNGGTTGPTIDPNYAGTEYVGPTSSGTLPGPGVGLGATGTPYSSGYQPQIPMYPVPNLNDIAFSTRDNSGNPIILYNPNVVAQVGQAVSQFFIAHEYGHIQLGHLNQLNADPYSRQQLELDADCWATQALGGANSAAVQAAYQFFYSQGNSANDAVHPTGIQRANTIESCAGGGSNGGYYGNSGYYPYYYGYGY